MFRRGSETLERQVRVVIWALFHKPPKHSRPCHRASEWPTRCPTMVRAGNNWIERHYGVIDCYSITKQLTTQTQYLQRGEFITLAVEHSVGFQGSHWSSQLTVPSHCACTMSCLFWLVAHQHVLSSLIHHQHVFGVASWLRLDVRLTNVSLGRYPRSILQSHAANHFFSILKALRPCQGCGRSRVFLTRSFFYLVGLNFVCCETYWDQNVQN